MGNEGVAQPLPLLVEASDDMGVTGLCMGVTVFIAPSFCGAVHIIIEGSFPPIPCVCAEVCTKGFEVACNAVAAYVETFAAFSCSSKSWTAQRSSSSSRLV